MEIPTNSLYSTLISNLAPVILSEVKFHKRAADTKSVIKMNLRRLSKNNNNTCGGNNNNNNNNNNNKGACEHDKSKTGNHAYKHKTKTRLHKDILGDVVHRFCQGILCFQNVIEFDATRGIVCVC